MGPASVRGHNDTLHALPPQDAGLVALPPPFDASGTPARGDGKAARLFKRITLAFLSLVVLWASIRMIWHYSPLSNYPGKIEMEAFFNLKIRLQDRAYWWVPLHLLSSVLLIGYVMVFIVKNLSASRHHRYIALVGLFWCFIMALNIDHAVALPPKAALLFNGCLISISLIMSLFLLRYASRGLIFALPLYIGLFDRLAGVWLILVVKYTDWATHIQTDLQTYLNS